MLVVECWDCALFYHGYWFINLWESSSHMSSALAKDTVWAILTSVDWQERRQESTRHPDNTNPNLPRQVKDKFDLLSPQSQPKRQTAQAVLLPNWLKTRKTSDECTLFTRHDGVINRERQLLNDVLKTSQLQHSNEPKTDASMAARAKITGDDKKQGTMKTTECTRTHRWHAKSHLPLL